MPSTWDNLTDIPDLTDKIAIVTGGNTGIGKECVRQLILHNATRVYIATRNESRAKTAIEDLSNAHPRHAVIFKSRVLFLKLDLENLKSCQEAAERFLSKETRLDILSKVSGIST